MLAGKGGSLAAAGASLLAWYDREQRDLPWRRTTEPYAVWLSEVMLQQTQVDTVAPRFDSFLERFPDPAALAAASEQQVVAAWSGLGYYRRARQLHAAAQRVVEAGRLPRTAQEWQRLPGIGEYTAAAIASISGGEVIAVLDGNVERVVSRLLASACEPKKAAVRRRLRAAAEQLLDRDRPGDTNQALMELGALVCRPREPACERCPLRASCSAAASGDPGRFPPARRRPATIRVVRQLFVVHRAGCTLLFRRSPTASTLPGFWELPWLDGAVRETLDRDLETKYGGRWLVIAGETRLRHAITNRRFVIGVHGGDWRSPAVEQQAAGWYSAEEIATLPTSSLVAKALAASADGKRR